MNTKEDAINGLTNILKSRQDIKDKYSSFLSEEMAFLSRLETRAPFGAVESVMINGRISTNNRYPYICKASNSKPCSQKNFKIYKPWQHHPPANMSQRTRDSNGAN